MRRKQKMICRCSAIMIGKLSQRNISDHSWLQNHRLRRTDDPVFRHQMACSMQTLGLQQETIDFWRLLLTINLGKVKQQQFQAEATMYLQFVRCSTEGKLACCLTQKGIRRHQVTEFGFPKMNSLKIVTQPQ